MDEMSCDDAPEPRVRPIDPEMWDLASKALGSLANREGEDVEAWAERLARSVDAPEPVASPDLRERIAKTLYDADRSDDPDFPDWWEASPEDRHEYYEIVDSLTHAPTETETERHGWAVEHGVTVVICPECCFSFDASHEDEGGGFSCPACPQGRFCGGQECACGYMAWEYADGMAICTKCGDFGKPFGSALTTTPGSEE